MIRVASSAKKREEKDNTRSAASTSLWGRMLFSEGSHKRCGTCQDIPTPKQGSMGPSPFLLICSAVGEHLRLPP